MVLKREDLNMADNKPKLVA